MSKDEGKEQINKVPDSAPDEVLENTLAELTELPSKSKSEMNLRHNISQVLEEDKEVLARLSK
jgi:hypothetical protein